PAVTHEAGKVRMDVVELLARVPTSEHSDERGVRDDEVVRGELRPRTAGESDRQQPAAARQRARCFLGERTADRVVHEVDAVTAGRVAQRRLERAVALVES